MSGDVRVNLITDDATLRTRLSRFNCRSSGLTITCSDQPLVDSKVDVYIVPFDALEELAAPAGGARSRVPIIAYGQAAQLAAAFAAGCADFLREPWTVDELAARVRKRALPRSFPTAVGRVILTRRGLSCRGRRAALTDPELRIFRALLLSAEQVVPRSVLFYALWGRDGGASRAVDAHVSSLRRKLGTLLPGTDPGKIIRSVRRGGYLLTEEGMLEESDCYQPVDNSG